MPRAYVEHTYIKRGSQNFSTIWSVLRQAGLVYTFQLSILCLLQVGAGVALDAVARGYYVKHRVFFADEPTAIAAGYRPCAICMKERYAVWKKAQTIARSREDALALYRAFLGLRVESSAST